MKKFKFVSRFAASVAAVALTLGSVAFTACSDDDEIDNSGIKSRLDVPAVKAVSAETDITKTSLTFSWEAVAEATGYQAQIRYSETGDIVREQISENTTITFENLNPGTQYFFRVCATCSYDEGRNSAYSTYVSATTEEADPTRPTFAVPAGVRCNMGETTENSLTFTWESVEGAEKYNVLLTAVGEDDRTFETTETSYTFNGLTIGTKYFFQVQAAEIVGEAGTNASAWSGAIKAVTTAKLQTPQNLTCKVKMAQAAQFVWNEVAGAKTYAYELTTLTASGSETKVTEGLMSELSDVLVPDQTVYATATTNTSMSFRGLEKDAYYAFRVKAVPASGQTETLESEFSDYYVIKTLAIDATPLATPTFKCKEAQQFKLMMTITPVDKAYGYDYQIATATDVADANEEGYILRKIRAGEDGTIPTEFVVGPKVVDADDESGEKFLELLPKTDYMFRMMTISDPNVLTDGDSSWSEWTPVKTADLTDALTLKEGDDIDDMLSRVKPGAVITLKAGVYNTKTRFTISQDVTIQGESATDRPKVNFSNFAIDPQAACAKIRIANIEFTNFKLNDDGTLSSTEYIGQYFIDFLSSQKVNVETFEVENCVVWGGFKSAFIRVNRSNFGVENLLVKNNIICVGGSDGSLIGANGKSFGKEWIITGNTIDAMGSVYGNTKTGQIIRFPNGGDEFVGKIENNTFYNISVIKGKNLFEAPQGTITVSKNIVTIDSTVTWTSNIGVNATLISTDNFIYDTTSTLEGFTVADPQITGYEFLKNYKPYHADVIAAGAGDPRWLD